MVRRNKDGGYDLRTKEGREAQERVENWNSPMGGCLLRFILLMIIVVVLGELFPPFQGWFNSCVRWLFDVME